MMIAVIAFSAAGAALAERIMLLEGEGHTSSRYIAERHADETGLEGFASVYEITSRLFCESDALVYIAACGIVVRAIAPLVESKLTDPAVVACDETGRFAVSLLSGHVGGANRLTEHIAEIIGATAVITTASDSYTVFSGWQQPQNLVLGIGCRRGTSAETIERAVTILLWDKKIPLSRVCEAATIDIKRDEAGLIRFATAHGIPLSFFPAGELANTEGEFAYSERVLNAVGVDNVCERAAVLCGGEGKLIMHKTAKDGVTVAVFERG